MTDQSDIEGGCLCGRVRYRVAGALFGADHCHCTMCQRQHGAAFATYADFKPADFSWVEGEDAIKLYETPSGAGWCFCQVCGSSLAASENGVITSVTLGTVAGDPRVKPAAHIFVGTKVPWCDINDGLPQYEARPPAAGKSSS